MPSPWIKTVLRVLAVVAIAMVAALALFNLLVASNVLESVVNGAQKDVTLSFDPDFIWWPTHIEGNDLQLIIHDPAIQAQLNIDRYEVDLYLLATFEKKFHATRVRASGVRFAIRKTRFLPELCAQPPGLPIIPGQSLPPGAGAGDCSDQVDTARTAGPMPERDQVVKVQLEDVKAEGLNELWFERHRARGYAAFEGEWFFHPTFETHFDVDDFSSEPWALHVDGRPVAESIRFDGAGSAESLQLRELSDWPDRVSLRGDLATKRLDVGHFAGVVGAAGGGSLDVYVDADIKAGVPEYLATRVRGTSITIEMGKSTVHGSPDVALRFGNASGAARLHAGTATITGLRLGAADAKATSLFVRTTSDSFVQRSPLRASIGLQARTTNLEPIMSALNGLPRTIIDLLIAQPTNIRARGRLEASPGEARLEPLHVEAGALSVDGRVQFVPDLDGSLKARLGPVTVEKKLGPETRSGTKQASSAKP